MNNNENIDDNLWDQVTILRKKNISQNNTLKKMERENIYIESLRLDLLSLLIELEDPENIEEESDSDSDSENCLRSMLKTTQEHLQMDEQNIIVNTIYILKNQAVTTFFGIVKFFFNMASF